MALPVKYKFRLKNETSVAIGAGEIVLRITRSKHGPADNAIAYESPLAVTLTNAGIIGNNAWGDIGGVQDNTALKFEEGVGTLECTISAPTPVGDVTLVLSPSSDTVFGDDGQDDGLVVIKTVSSVSLEKKSFRFR